MACCTKLAMQPCWQQVIKPLAVAKLLRGAQAHAACLPAAAGRQKCNADTVAVPPWLPCSRHRCVHQVTDCMLPKVLIPNCCRLLMSCCSSRVGWPLHFAAPFYSLTTALAEPCASKVGKCPACCSSHTCLNPYRNVPCAAPQPAPYTFRVSRLLLCCAPAAGWFPHDSFSERCTTSRDKASIGCLQVGTSWVTAPPGKPRGVIHFEPGAFVGAAPQLTYQLLIQLLSGAGYTVGVLCCT